MPIRIDFASCFLSIHPLLIINCLQQKDPDQNELAVLQNPDVHSLLLYRGPIPDPLSFDVNGVTKEITVWPELCSAPNTLQKLILTANIFLKLDPVWRKIKLTSRLSLVYSNVQAILSCVKLCFRKDLVQLQ